MVSLICSQKFISLFYSTANNYYPLFLCENPISLLYTNVTCTVAGVVISMVSQKNGDGFALVLDGTTFEEIARAKFPYGLPYGLHGCWVPKN